MSHHIGFDAPLPSEKNYTERQTKKKDAEIASAKKRESKKLDIDNKQMEWRLHQLKLAMEKEKEERGKQTYIWKSGKDGALESHARNILGRTIKPRNSAKSEGKKTKKGVKVLMDEPLDVPKRKSHSKDLIARLKSNGPDSLLPKEEKSANHPHVYNQSWISISLDKSNDEVMEIQSDSDGNLPLEVLHGLAPASIGLYFVKYARKRLLLAVDGKVLKPKTGWGSEVYFPYFANVSPLPPQMAPAPPRKPRREKMSLEDPTTPKGGQLLQGSFDEEQNAKAFQQAVIEWRKGNSQKSQPASQELSSVASVEMSEHVVQSEPVEVNVTFSQTTTLSYMERLLLKKHRVTEIPPLPGSNETRHEDSGNNTSELTEEEIEERERYRELFTPQPSQHSANTVSSIDMHEQFCSISEVEAPVSLPQNGNWMESFDVTNETVCYVDEATDEEDNHLNSSFVTSSKNDHLNICDLGQQFSLSNGVSEPSILDKYSTKLENEHFKHEEDDNRRMQDEHHGFNDSHQSLEINNNIVKFIGEIPLNPDAVYQQSLGDFHATMNSEWDALQSKLDQPAQNILLCHQGNAQWMADQSIARHISQDHIADAELPEESKDPFTRQEQDIENPVTHQEQDNEDAKTLNQLEWELASQTGNITSDGRISRLIDEWSSDEEDVALGIINDPGFGSGLSTPELDHVSLGTGLSWRGGGQSDEDFRKMEDFMLGDVNSESESDEDNV
ncbi:uncharacterized protein LOC143445567 [Clavelina lepadiformis]|uniref:uncharacterized protein LOC143445567 n=1 Tax=Clavelina lepadiformis TaxID=159417 RepID=UPI0040429A3C